MKKSLSFLPLLIIFFSFLSCAPSVEKIQAELKIHPEWGKYLQVKFIPSKDFLCGASSLAMLFSYYGKKVSVEEIAEKYFSARAGGLFTVDLIACAREYGFEPKAESGGWEKLKKALDEEKPVIVFYNQLPEPLPARHFALVVGYYQKDGNIWLILHSGKKPNQLISKKKLERMWKRTDFWMMTIQPSSNKSPFSK